jgi:hypothetical protein
MSTLKPGHSSHTDKDGNLIQVDVDNSRVKYSMTAPDGTTVTVRESGPFGGFMAPRTEELTSVKEKAEKALHKKKNGY